jgi:hypothetical protein
MRRADPPSSLQIGPGDPISALGASLAWRADDAVDNGANTTSIPSYIGSLTLTRDGVGPGVKTTSTNFVGLQSLLFGAAAQLSNASFGAVPAAVTVVTVCRPTASAAGFHAITVGGTVNTGNSSLYDASETYAQKISTPAKTAFTVPNKVILVSVFDAAGIKNYTNSYTPVEVASAGALAGDTFTLGALSTSGIYTLTGEWRTTGYWPRALRPSDVALLIDALGAREGITILP